MLTIAIIGAGPLGRWLALAAARAGFRVLLEDVMPANLHHAREYIRRQLGPEARSGATHDAPLRSEEPSGFPPPKGEGAPSSKSEDTDTALASVRFVTTIEDAVRHADLAIDCVPDELESKLEILWLLDRMAPPHTVLATPTRQLSITDLAACTYRPEQCVALVAEPRELAEQTASGVLVRTTSRTSSATIAVVGEFWRGLGIAAEFEIEAVPVPAGTVESGPADYPPVSTDS